MRVFFCLELDREVRAALGRAVGELKRRIGTAKWVHRDSLHLTVRFIGEVDEPLVAELSRLGTETARAVSPFSFTLTRLGAFPSPRRARVIWAGPEEAPPGFLTLVGKVEAGVVGLGLPPETKAASPHVTLARLKPPRDIAAAIGGIALPEIRVGVDSLTLMRSQLTPQGPIYTPLKRWQLGG